MNERNVDALAALLLEFTGDDSSDLAEWLASRSVLVPSALTVYECQALGDRVFTPEVRRTMLERIAKGEP